MGQSLELKMATRGRSVGKGEVEVPGGGPGAQGGLSGPGAEFPAGGGGGGAAEEEAGATLAQSCLWRCRWVLQACSVQC